jgi:4-hydroxythreonine-4-phosphate dehydrogenase
MLAQRPLPDVELVAIADPDLLLQRAKRLGLEIELLLPERHLPPQPHQPGQLRIAPIALREAAVCGKLNTRNADYVLETLTHATEGCLSGDYAGLVTGPVHKGVINDAGLPFTGHTEFLAELCQAHPVMLLATPGLRVALVTTHLPIAQVSQAITAERLRQVATILHQDLQQRFGLKQPHILVCGLNPHAGEQGHLGHEEIEIIEPVLAELNTAGMQLIGPMPADTVFTPVMLQQADAVLSMYHDQGLPVLKHLGFGKAVNVTLGLPIIRTSVDHGTALPLAGTGQVNLGSLQYAVKVATEMAVRNDKSDYE